MGKAGEHGGYQEQFTNLGVSEDIDRAVCVLNQHPVKHSTIAHSDGSLPTFLSSGHQKIWSMNRNRWITAKEKFAAMMWPVTADLAESLKRPLVDVQSCDGHARIGNAMHIGNTMLILLAVLGSTERIDATPSKADALLCFLQCSSVLDFHTHDFLDLYKGLFHCHFACCKAITRPPPDEEDEIEDEVGFQSSKQF